MNNRHTLLLLALVTGFFFSIPYAQAEIFSIQGKNADIGIFIFIEDRDNIMKIYTEKGDAEFYDSKVKLYKSGGFSIKNYGVGVWGHPISDSQYDLVILTSEGVQRITASTNEVNEVGNVEEKPQRIEPKSSVGVDITKWNIPTNIPRAEEKSILLGIKGDRIESLHLGDRYERTFKIIDVRKNNPLIGADVTLEITRDGFMHKKIVKESNQGGIVYFELRDLNYPLFYPNFCYEVKVVATYGNFTQTWNDEFLMLHSGAWNPNMEWISESRWNYLPSSFTDEPRQIVNLDSHCD